MHIRITQWQLSVGSLALRDHSLCHAMYKADLIQNLSKSQTCTKITQDTQYYVFFSLIYTTSKFNKRLGVTNLLILIIIIFLYKLEYKIWLPIKIQHILLLNENYNFIYVRSTHIELYIVFNSIIGTNEQYWVPLSFTTTTYSRRGVLVLQIYLDFH